MRKRRNRGLKLVNEFKTHEPKPTKLGKVIMVGWRNEDFDSWFLTIQQYVRVPRICNIHNKNHK